MKIHPLFYVYINRKAKLLEIFVTLQKNLRKLNHINFKRKLVGLLRHCKKSSFQLKNLQCCKFLKLNQRDIYPHIIDLFFTYTVRTYTKTIQPWHYFLGLNVTMKVLVKLLSLDKSYSYIAIYSFLHLIFDSLQLIYYNNFLTFIQSHNIYS